MKHRAGQLLTLMSALLCILALAAWPRSLRMGDAIACNTAGGNSYWLGAHPHGAHLGVATNSRALYAAMYPDAPSQPRYMCSSVRWGTVSSGPSPGPKTYALVRRPTTIPAFAPVALPAATSAPFVLSLSSTQPWATSPGPTTYALVRPPTTVPAFAPVALPATTTAPFVLSLSSTQPLTASTIKIGTGSITINGWYPPAHDFMGFGWESYQQTIGSPFVGNPIRYGLARVAVPLWFGALLFAIAPVLQLRRTLRQRHRRRHNLCLRCGYDLRATPERCPECGLDVAR